MHPDDLGSCLPGDQWFHSMLSIFLNSSVCVGGRWGADMGACGSRKLLLLLLSRTNLPWQVCVSPVKRLTVCTHQSITKLTCWVAVWSSYSLNTSPHASQLVSKTCILLMADTCMWLCLLLHFLPVQADAGELRCSRAAGSWQTGPIQQNVDPTPHQVSSYTANTCY